MEEEGPAQPSAARPATPGGRATLIGLMIIFASSVLTFSPLLLGKGSLNRFIVVAGLVGLMIGGSCVIHGAWDWLVARRG